MNPGLWPYKPLGSWKWLRSETFKTIVFWRDLELDGIVYRRFHWFDRKVKLQPGVKIAGQKILRKKVYR